MTGGNQKVNPLSLIIVTQPVIRSVYGADDVMSVTQVKILPVIYPSIRPDCRIKNLLHDDDNLSIWMKMKMMVMI